MAISYANIQVTKVLTLRGNTIQNNRYTGLPGELTVDTQAKTIRIHDGVTPGGNVIQGASGASSYANANVKVYLTAFDGNIIPSANAVYSLGTVTNQWKSLFVSNSTIYVGGVPLSIDNTGNLTVNGNTIPTIGYVNTIVANVTVDLSSYALNANVTAANVGMKGYVDQQITDLIGGAPSILDTLNEIAASINDDANVYTSLTNSIATANTALKGYVDSQSFYSNAKVSTYLPTYSGNVANIRLGTSGRLTLADGSNINDGFFTAASNSSVNLLSNNEHSQIRVDNNNVEIYTSPNGSTQYQWTFGQNGALTLPESANGKANIILPYDKSLNITTTDAESGNISQWLFNQSGATYLPNNLYILDGQFVFFSNLGNAATLSGSINQNYELHVGGFNNKIWTFGHNGNLTFPTGAGINNGYPGGTIGDGQGWFVTPSGNSGGVASADGQQYVQVNDGYGVEIGTGWPGNAHAWHFGLNATLTLPTTGRINFDYLSISSYSDVSTFYAPSGNVQLAAGIGDAKIVTNSLGSSKTWTFGTDGNLTLPSNISSINYANGVSILSGLGSGGGSNYSNVNVKAYTESMGFVNYSNVNVAAYLATATINTTGNITAGNLITSGALYVANITTTGASGNISGANYITANFFIGNGSQLTGLPAGYSNVQVATYLPTYTGTLAGGTLNLAGQDGTTVADFQTGAATNQIITLGSNYTFSIKAGAGASNRGSLVLESGQNSRVRVNGSGSNVLITAGNGTQSSTWTFANSGVLTFPDGTTQSTAGGSSNYGNVNVKAYTESMGFQNYGNSNVTAYLNATGYNLYSNVNVAAYLSTATINTTGNITAQNLTGNISITGNVTGTSANVTLQAGSFSSTFDNQGNVRLPTAYVTGNVTANYFVGNGALLTGIAASSNYSNVNVATYLPTYSGNIANIRLGPSGVLTFADGTTQTTAGGGSYSNVQVAAYLTTGVNTSAPQIQLTNATSNFIKYNNVGVGAPTFTTANIGTRIIYWSSVDANTADYAVGIDAGVLWHGIPRATSGFAFKWYGGTTQIAVLEGTGLFTIANIRLSPSGNIVFADGTVQTTAATGTYSNIQVATYLPTYTGSLNASNILVTSANITIANIQATTAATNTATGALRVMGGVGVAGAVVAGQLNSTGNVVANAISAYSLNTVANVVASVVNAGTINSAGNVLAQNIIGTIATASQTGITAVGTLATLTVSGNVNSSNFVGSTPNVQLIANTSITTFDIYGNVTFPGNNVISSLGITMPTRPAFRVNGTSLYGGAQSTANVNLKGVAVSTQYNQGNYFDATTGKFTAPVAGIYEVLLNSRVNSSFNGLAQLVVLKNGLNTSGNIVAFWETTSNAAGATHFGVSGTVVLATGDYLSANILSGNIVFDQNDNWSVTYIG